MVGAAMTLGVAPVVTAAPIRHAAATRYATAPRHASAFSHAMASAASPTWTEKGLMWGSASDPAVSLSCPDVSDCWATDTRGGIYASDDGGAVWSQEYQVNTGYSVPYIDCATVTSCVAIENQYILWTDNGGAFWNTSPLEALSLSCPSATTCFATSGHGAIDESTDGGATWSQLSTTLTAQFVTCPSATVCYGDGYDGMVRTTDGGATWETVASPPPVFPIDSITCAT